MRSPRRDALLFVAVAYAISSLLYIIIIRRGTLTEGAGGGLLVWTPSLVGIALSLLLGYRGRGLGLRLPSLSMAVVGTVVPLAAVAASVVLLLVSGIDRLKPALQLPPFWLGLALYLVGALGEELGWRGFLQSRLREAGVSHVWARVGVVWALWHVPLILAGLYASSPRPWISALIFVVTITSYGIFLGWLRDASESVWAVIVGHAAHNLAVLYYIPELLAPGRRHDYLYGESGVYLALAYVAIAGVVLYRGKSPPAEIIRSMRAPSVSEAR